MCTQNVLRILHRLWEKKVRIYKGNTNTIFSLYSGFKGLGCRLFTCLLDVSYSVCFPTFTNQQRFWGFPDCPVPPHTFVPGCARLPHTALPQAPSHLQMTGWKSPTQGAPFPARRQKPLRVHTDTSDCEVSCGLHRRQSRGSKCAPHPPFASAKKAHNWINPLKPWLLVCIKQATETWKRNRRQGD